jgi:hypothetical protein
LHQKKGKDKKFKFFHIILKVSKIGYAQRLSVYEVVAFEKRQIQLTTKAK